jgi:hypothetical protein
LFLIAYDDMKRISISFPLALTAALLFGIMLALTATLALTVFMQRQWNLEAQRDRQRIEARRLGEQQQQQLEEAERRLEARRLDEQLTEQKRLDALEDQLAEQKRLEQLAKQKRLEALEEQRQQLKAAQRLEALRLEERQQRQTDKIELRCTGTLTTWSASGLSETPANVTLVIDPWARLISGELGQFTIAGRTNEVGEPARKGSHTTAARPNTDHGANVWVDEPNNEDWADEWFDEEVRSAKVQLTQKTGLPGFVFKRASEQIQMEGSLVRDSPLRSTTTEVTNLWHAHVTTFHITTDEQGIRNPEVADKWELSCLSVTSVKSRFFKLLSVEPSDFLPRTLPRFSHKKSPPVTNISIVCVCDRSSRLAVQ